MNSEKEYPFIKINELKPYENNARLHPQDQVDKIANSIREFGFITPVIIDENNMILVGHGRIEGAKQVGLEEVPYRRITNLTDEQKKAYILADNKLSDIAEWDEELLKIELESISLDMSAFGFDEFNIDIDCGFNEEVVEDEVPEVPVEPKAKLGDIYKLGRHRLICGDSTDENVIAKLLMGGQSLAENVSPKIDMVFTDPPYGMSAVSKSGVLQKNYKTDILNDDTNEVAIESFILSNRLFDKARQVWWGANYYTECLPSAECLIVWDKNNGGSDQTDCELAWTNFRSVVRQFTLASEKVNRVHPTQKPVKLIVDIFKKFEKETPFINIIDLFGGSGSTLIACEQLGRTCYTCELDPKYVDVIIERWENFTGQKAELIKGEQIWQKRH